MSIDDSEKAKEAYKELEKEFEPLTSWLKENALKVCHIGFLIFLSLTAFFFFQDKIEKAVVSQRLVKSPSALVASSYGWSGNMERIMKSQAYAKAKDPTQEFYASQKKTFEINPRHPVVKELLKRVVADSDDQKAKDTATLLFETATLRSGFTLQDQVLTLVFGSQYYTVSRFVMKSFRLDLRNVSNRCFGNHLTWRWMQR